MESSRCGCFGIKQHCPLQAAAKAFQNPARELRDNYQSLPIEWTRKSSSVTLQTDSGPQFASIWLPKFVCVRACVCIIPWSTERVRGLHCLCPLQPLSSISWTWSWLRTVRSKELTAFINWRRERHRKWLCEDWQRGDWKTSQQKDVQRCTS